MFKTVYAGIFIIITIFFSNLCFAQVNKIEEINPALEKEISNIQYQVTAIEHTFQKDDKNGKAKAYGYLIKQCDELITKYPDRAEPYTWKGICLSAQAKYIELGALPNIYNARKALEKSIQINPKASNAAALNALRMLYYKVPAFPIAFGSDKKAREYFKKALLTSSNLDTNYRYGEFLVEKGEIQEGKMFLERALNFPDRPGKKEDPLKKQDVKKLLETLKGRT